MNHPFLPLRALTLTLLAATMIGCADDRSSGSNAMTGETDPGAVGVAGYQQTPEAIESGRRIFDAQVCSRCHKETGPVGIGPNLWDGEWLYGGEPEDIYESIMHGRPRGMAPYQGRLGAQEVWHIVAYLRSASSPAE